MLSRDFHHGRTNNARRSRSDISRPPRAEAVVTTSRRASGRPVLNRHRPRGLDLGVGCSRSSRGRSTVTPSAPAQLGPQRRIARSAQRAASHRLRPSGLARPSRSDLQASRPTLGLPGKPSAAGDELCCQRCADDLARDVERMNARTIVAAGSPLAVRTALTTRSFALSTNRRSPPMTGWDRSCGSRVEVPRALSGTRAMDEKSAAAGGNRAAPPSNATRCPSADRMDPGRRGEIGEGSGPGDRRTRWVVRSRRPPASGPDAEREGARTVAVRSPRLTRSPVPRVASGWVRASASSANVDCAPSSHWDRTASRSTVTARVRSRFANASNDQRDLRSRRRRHPSTVRQETTSSSGSRYVVATGVLGGHLGADVRPDDGFLDDRDLYEPRTVAGLGLTDDSRGDVLVPLGIGPRTYLRRRPSPWRITLHRLTVIGHDLDGPAEENAVATRPQLERVTHDRRAVACERRRRISSDAKGGARPGCRRRRCRTGVSRVGL